MQNNKKERGKDKEKYSKGKENGWQKLPINHKKMEITKNEDKKAKKMKNFIL